MTVTINGSGSITEEITIDGVKVGQGGGNVSTNTAVGASALAANEAGGTNNTAVGYQALDANTTGDKNTAVGDSALGANTTGSDNTAVGYQAGYSNTTGSGAVALGHDALYANTTGNQNVALGNQALLDNTTGSDNVAVGAFALENNTTANYNVAVGRQALYLNTTASNNTAVGYQAGYSNTTGASNTFIGYLAGSIITGSNNIVLGADNAITNSGNNCIYIGRALAAGTASSSHELILSTLNVAGKGANTGFITANGGSGSIYQGNNNASWATTSDARIKENFKDINGLDVISALHPVSFDYIENKRADVGFIAQEYMQVLPEQVHKHAANPFEKELVGEDEIYGINPNLVPYLVKAIQELSAQVTALQAEVEALKGQ
jgi:hypothetical protein